MKSRSDEFLSKTEAADEFLTSSTVDVITDNNYSDIIIEDDNGNALVQFAEGHIKTKNFDSRNLSTPSIPFLDLSGKTVGFLGDSITYGVGASSNATRYSTVFCSIANCTERNLGNSGTCLAANTKNGRTSERFITRVTSANITGLDLLIIFGGTNDFSYDIKAVGNHFEEETITGNTYRGTKKRVANSDNESFSGALHELILAIRAINPALPIVYLTPLSRGVYNTTEPRGTSYETNANGDYISDFVDAIKDICAFYSVPVFNTVDHFPYDMAQDVKNAVVTGISTDAIHPNDKGHAILAQTLYKWTITNISI
ncbi:MAG: SGNH/GDSL hydrolase family protein [Bacilli bacterium]|nr:SGNH/GDSL hydrolase family protein [Bacilli bacterium]